MSRCHVEPLTARQSIGCSRESVILAHIRAFRANLQTQIMEVSMNAKQLLMFVVLGAAVGASLLSGCTLQGPIYRDSEGWRQDRGDAAKTGWHLWFVPEPTGRVVWRKQVGAMIASSPAVAPDGTVYVGTEDTARALVAINPDGTERWAVPIAGQRVRTTPAIRSDGSLVVVSYQQVPCRPYDGKGLVSLISRSGETLLVSQEFETSGLSAPMLDARDNGHNGERWVLGDRL